MTVHSDIMEYLVMPFLLSAGYLLLLGCLVFGETRSDCPKELISRIKLAVDAVANEDVQLKKRSVWSQYTTATAKLTPSPSLGTLTQAAVCANNGVFKVMNITLNFAYEINIPDYVCNLIKVIKKVKMLPTAKGQIQVRANVESGRVNLFRDPEIKHNCKNPADEVAGAILATFRPALKNAMLQNSIFNFAVCPQQLRDSFAGIFDSFAVDGLDLPRASLPQYKNKPFLKALRYKLFAPAKATDLRISMECRCKNETERMRFYSMNVKPPAGTSVFEFKMYGDPLDNSQLCTGRFIARAQYAAISVVWPGGNSPPGAKASRVESQRPKQGCPNWPRSRTDSLIKMGNVAEQNVVETVWRDFEAVLPHRLLYVAMIVNCDPTALTKAGDAFVRMFQDGYTFDDGAGTVTFTKPISIADTMLFPCRTSPAAVSEVATIRNLPVGLTLTLQPDACPNVEATQKATSSLGFDVVVGTSADSVDVRLPESQPANVGQCAPLKDRMAAINNGLRDLVRDTILQLSYGREEPSLPKGNPKLTSDSTTEAKPDISANHAGNSNKENGQDVAGGSNSNGGSDPADVKPNANEVPPSDGDDS